MGTGFQCHIKGAVDQVFGSQEIGSRGDGYHLGMGSHIIQLLGHVMGTGYDAVLVHDDRPHRDLLHFESFLCLFQG